MEYEKYLERAKGCSSMFRDEISKANELVNKLVADVYLSEIGKTEKKKSVCNEVDGVADNLTGIFKKNLSAFLDEFSLNLPEDGKDHSQDVANALRIIDMLGFEIDANNLRNAISPLLGSYTALRTVIDVLDTKHTNSIVGGYKVDVMEMVHQYKGVTADVGDYLDTIDRLKDIVNNPMVKYTYQMTSTSYGSATHITDATPYEMLACADWMNNLVKLYASLEESNAQLFTGHIKTMYENYETTVTGRKWDDIICLKDVIQTV